ncbi:hypothetical protein [Streptacidiphilus anmyonensis]|uniref:hypothetical protein n=1 Tax=Streptacidiphilus anmyonensis TaxID=405782 RepID=UPI0005A634A7|nr:hypothetical protein [Streptacidiphilus anmyonensis]
MTYPQLQSPPPRARRRSEGRPGYLDLPARILAAVGLAVDGAVHAYLAGHYALSAPGISIGTWFRVEAVVAGLAALLVIALRRLVSDLLGWLTAAVGLIGLIVYQFAGLYEASPFVDLNELLWTAERTLSLPAQGLAVVCLTPLLVERLHRTADRPA